MRSTSPSSSSTAAAANRYDNNTNFDRKFHTSNNDVEEDEATLYAKGKKIQQQSDASLDRCLKVCAEIDENARDSAAALHDQTNTMKRIAGDLNRIEQDTKTSNRILAHMEKNPVSQFFIGMLGMEPKGITAPPQSAKPSILSNLPKMSIPFVGGGKKTDHDAERKELMDGSAAKSGGEKNGGGSESIQDDIKKADQKMDRKLDAISDALKNIKAQATDINNEVKVHNSMLDDLSGRMDARTAEIHKTSARVRRL